MGYVVKLGGPGPDPKKENAKPAASAAGGGALSQIPTRTLAIGGGVLAVLILAGGLWFAFGRGDNTASATDIDSPGMTAPGMAGAAAPAGPNDLAPGTVSPAMAGASDTPPGMAGAMAPGMAPGMVPGMAPGVTPDMAPGIAPAAAPGMAPGMAPGAGAGAVPAAPDFSGTPGYNPADAKDSGG